MDVEIDDGALSDFDDLLIQLLFNFGYYFFDFGRMDPLRGSVCGVCLDANQNGGRPIISLIWGLLWIDRTGGALTREPNGGALCERNGLRLFSWHSHSCLFQGRLFFLINN